MRIPKGFSLNFFEGKYKLLYICHPEPDYPGCAAAGSLIPWPEQISAFQTQRFKLSFQTQLSKLRFPNSAFQNQLPNSAFQTWLLNSASKRSFHIQLSELSFQSQLSNVSFGTQLSTLSFLNSASKFSFQLNFAIEAFRNKLSSFAQTRNLVRLLGLRWDLVFMCGPCRHGY